MDSECRLPGHSLTWTCVKTSSRFSALCHGARRAKWAGRHFTLCQRAEAAPWGAAGAHASEPSSPFATLPLFPLLSRCFSLPLFFCLCLTYLVFISYTWRPLPGRLLLGRPRLVRPIKLVFTGSRDCGRLKPRPPKHYVHMNKIQL